MSTWKKVRIFTLALAVLLGGLQLGEQIGKRT